MNNVTDTSNDKIKYYLIFDSIIRNQTQMIDTDKSYDEIKYDIIKAIRNEVTKYLISDEAMNHGIDFDKFCIFCNESTKYLNNKTTFNFQKFSKGSEFIFKYNIDQFISMIKATSTENQIDELVFKFNNYLLDTA